MVLSLGNTEQHFEICQSNGLRGDITKISHKVGEEYNKSYDNSTLQDNNNNAAAQTDNTLKLHIFFYNVLVETFTF